MSVSRKAKVVNKKPKQAIKKKLTRSETMRGGEVKRHKA